MEGREWFEKPFLTSETIKLTVGDHYDSPGAVAWRTKNGSRRYWPRKGGPETPGDSNWVGVTPVKTIFYSPNDPGSSGVDGLGEEVDTIDTNRSGFYTIEYKVEFTYRADTYYGRENDVVRGGAATRTVIVRDPVQIATWGYTGEGGLGGPRDSGYRDVWASQSAFAAIKRDGSIFTWGDGMAVFLPGEIRREAAKGLQAKVLLMCLLTNTGLWPGHSTTMDGLRIS